MTQGPLVCTRCGRDGHVAASCPVPLPPPYRGIATIDDLRARSIVDPVRHCWLWSGAFRAGVPVIYGWDPRIQAKRALSGPLAAWIIAFGEAPSAGSFVGRRCGSLRCVNPAHLIEWRTQREMNDWIRATGRRRGKHVEARRQAAARGRAQQGLVETPPEIIVAVAQHLLANGYQRGDGRRLAAQFGLTAQHISRIATGKRLVPGIGLLSLGQAPARAHGAGTAPASIANLRPKA